MHTLASTQIILIYVGFNGIIQICLGITLSCGLPPTKKLELQIKNVLLKISQSNQSHNRVGLQKMRFSISQITLVGGIFIEKIII